jgi:hypothetical protein
MVIILVFNYVSTLFLKFIYSHVHTLFGPFLPPTHPPQPSLPNLPSLPGRTCSALISNFVEEKTEAIMRKTK